MNHIPENEGLTVEFKSSFNVTTIETFDDLLNNNYKSTPRNKMIADFCKDLGLIEKYGSGIRRVMNLCREAEMPLPKIAQLSGGVNVTFESNENITPQATPQALNDNIQSLYRKLMPDAEYNRNELMDILNMSDRRYVQANYIKPLLDAGLLVLKYQEKPNHPRQKYICKK